MLGYFIIGALHGEGMPSPYMRGRYREAIAMVASRQKRTFWPLSILGSQGFCFVKHTIHSQLIDPHESTHHCKPAARTPEWQREVFGWESWRGQISTAILSPAPLEKQPEPQEYEGLVLVNMILDNLVPQRKTIVDARSPDRFHGQNETLDPVAGHIPGSLNRFYKSNLKGGTFKSPDILRNEFYDLLVNIQASDVIHSCGSGVTACHNLLAMEYAGLSGSHLYAGSWSEWCADPKRPVEL
jgi:hypothetical protein